MTSLEDIRETIVTMRRRVREIDALIEQLERMPTVPQAVAPTVHGRAQRLITSTRRPRASSLSHQPAA